MMFSSPSYSEWKKVLKSDSGINFYIDFDNIRKVDGYVYWWGLIDYLEPINNFDLSHKEYNKGDCKLSRYKTLSSISYKEHFGKGTGNFTTPKKLEWIYPKPNSLAEMFLNLVCNYKK